MRLLHTADWHLGRRLRGVDRTPEIALALEAVLATAIAESVDAVLVAGDLFDAPNPPAEAERVAYRFFAGLQEAGIPAVVIAGNHDSPARFEGVAGLLALAGVRSLGRPRLPEDGGLITIETKSGTLKVAAMPFASERRLAAEDLWNKGADQQIAGYQDGVRWLAEELVRNFTPTAVNVMIAHLAFAGATLAHSEAPFYTRDAYALPETLVPATAQYVALGHIHTHQRLLTPVPTYYCGSLIQVDFGEADEAKGFYVVDLEPGRPATEPRFIQVEQSRPLHVIRCSLAGLDDQLAANRDHPGFLKFVIEMDGPRLGIADRVRATCPQALVIEARYPEAPTAPLIASDPREGRPDQAFGRYYAERLGTPPRPEVVAAFRALHDELRLAHESEPAHAPA